LGTFGTGQKVTNYSNIISGPRGDHEADGPDEMYVILLDNGRTDVLKKERQRRALSCIKCGACLNVCPVYKNIGGYTYSTVYSGPIGSVLTPYMKGFREYKHLSYASSLCGSCTEVCPVKIPLHEFLLLNRNEAVKQGYISGKESVTMRRMKKAVMRRKSMNFGSNGLKNTALRYFFRKSWGPRRALPVFREKSFNKQWKEKMEHSHKKH
jgi:L-lactate dehydrogenase complex protein LldF